MKIVLIVVAVLVLIGSFVADYKWREWIVARRRDREHDPSNR